MNQPKIEAWDPSRQIAAATREYFARGFRIERALRIVMAYAGLAEWRKGDRRRLAIVERATGRNSDALDLLASQRIEITLDRERMWSLVVDVSGLRVTMHSERWHGRCAALNASAPIAPLAIEPL